MSGIVDLGHDVAGNPVKLYGDVVLGGIPLAKNPGLKGTAGIITDLAVDAASHPGVIQTVGTTTQLEGEGLAGPIGLAKIGLDTLTFTYGFAFVCQQ